MVLFYSAFFVHSILYSRRHGRLRPVKNPLRTFQEATTNPGLEDNGWQQFF